jgi:amino acid transporter
MTRIFTTLATIDGLALALSFLFGVVSKWRDASQHAHDSIYLVHFTLGLFAAIGTLLVHCIIFTYFLGTGRWVKEVKIAYDLPDQPWPLLTRELKRKTFPPALAAMLITIATAAAGAGAQLQEWSWYVHGSLAVITLIVNLWAFRLEYRHIKTNSVTIEEVLREVDRIRAERGLSANADALQEQE